MTYFAAAMHAATSATGSVTLNINVRTVTEVNDTPLGTESKRHR